MVDTGLIGRFFLTYAPAENLPKYHCKKRLRMGKSLTFFTVQALTTSYHLGLVRGNIMMKFGTFGSWNWE
jgi:hypothetical protein